MDGTLTVAAHDFNAIRRELGLPEGQPILETIDTLPEDEAARAHQILLDMELEVARRSLPQPGAEDLLDGLQARGARLGIVTRNCLEGARETLAAASLSSFFATADIVVRETCAPKPSPDGVLFLLQSWAVAPTAAVMVGDSLYDLQAGRAAGTATVHLDVSGAFAWPDQTDHPVTSLGQLAALANGIS